MASGSIKGITIEIEGKTSGLVKSLKDVNKSLANTQKALKTVNQALKLNPKDVQTLKTKQDLLNSAIEDTRKKLELEQQAAADAAEALEKGTITKDEYNTLQAEVAKTAAELNKLEQEAEETAKAVEKIGKGATRLDALSSKLKEVGTKMQEVGDKISAVGEKMQKFGAAYTATVTAPIVAMGKASLDAFNEVDGGLDKIIAKTGATGDELKGLEDIAKGLATSIPVSFDEAGSAVGEINTKFGATGDELRKLSELFLKFAQINETDVVDSIDSAQKALSAWGKSSKDAEGLLDAINRTSQKTGISVDTLSSGLVSNATAFQEMGLSMDEAVTAMGQIEMSGADVNVVLGGLSKALKKATSDGIPLDQALSDLEKTILSENGSVEELSATYELFGKSGDKVFAALKNGSLSFTELGNAANDSKGSVTTTFDAMQDGSDKLTTAMNSVKLALSAVGESLGNTLAPMLEKASEKLQELSKWWEDLDPKMQDFIIKAAMAAAAIGPVVLALGTVISGVGDLVSGIGGITSGIGGLIGEGGALAGIMTKLGIGTAAAEGGAAGLGAALSEVIPIIGIVIAAVAALTAAIAYLWTNNEDFRNSMTQLFAEFQAMGASVLPQIQEMFTALGEAVSAVWDIIGPSVVELMRMSMEDLLNVIQPALLLITGLFQAFAALLNGDTEALTQALTQIWQSFGDLLLALIITALHSLVTQFMVQVGLIAMVISQALANIWNKVKSVFESIKNFIVSVWTSIVSAVTTAVNNVKEKIQTGFSAAMNYIKSLPAQALSWGRDLISNFTNGIMEKMNALKQKVSDMAATIRSYLHFSEPDVGPLSDFNTYAPDMVKNFAQGIEKNLPVLQRATNDMAGTIADTNYSGQLNTINQSIQGLALAGGGGQVVIQLDSQVLARAVMKQQQNFNYRSGGR